jgi:AcrR family transcriptional regulator
MVSTAPVHVRPATAERILDAAFGCIERVGLARTTVEDVARAAGLSRQSVYRYFPSKDHLIMGLVLREEERFLDGIRMAFERDTDLRQAIEDSLLFCLRFARQHPLLDRLLQTDPGTLLPYLTTRSAPVVARARETVLSLIRRKSWVRADLVEQVGDTVVRAVISYALHPPERRVEDVARDLATIATIALTRKEARSR